MLIKKAIYNCESLNDNFSKKNLEIEYTSVCPMCHKSGDPSYLSSYYIDDEHTYPNLFVHFFCHNCEKTFLGNYHIGPYHGLTELMGFEPISRVEEREFPKHIKDLSIMLQPNNKDNIVKAPLSRCINDYIDNNRIKKLAVASAWLGNDETHYERKFKDYNIDNLVEFINAIVSFIDSDISAVNAERMIEGN